jgi:glycosyltransferase involved in cell wall biosynthesis
MWTRYRLPGVLRDLNRREKFDAILVHNTFQAAAVASAKLDARTAFRYYAPASMEIRVDAAKGKYGAKAKAIKSILKWVDRQEFMALNGVGRVSILSKYTAKQLEDLHPNFKSPVELIPGSVDTCRFSFAADTQAAKVQLGISPQRTVLLTVRRLVGRMGLEALVRSMDYVRQSCPEVLLVIAGRGYLESHLKSLAAELNLCDHVRFAGFVADADLPTHYRAADLFVLPTEDLEGFGIVTIESLSSGTPVAATEVGANPEVAGGFDASLVSGRAEPKQLSHCILNGIGKAYDAKYRRACRTHVEEHYSKERVVDQIEQLIS